MSNTNATALQNTPAEQYEPVLKRDIKANGKILKQGTVFIPTGAKFDANVIKHYCYMRPVQKEVKDA